MSRMKYRNRICHYMGMTFQSTKERDRYIFLKDAENRGLISDLKTQVSYEVIPAALEEYQVQLKTKVATRTRTIFQATHYIADFTYMKDGKVVVEDVKGSEDVVTEVFKMKEKLMMYHYGIRIRKVYKPAEEI